MKRLLFCLIVSASLVLSQTNRVPSLHLKMVDGKETTILQLLQDGPMLIDFWALWCAPCLKAMRHLDGFHKKYAADNFRVLAINLDTESVTEVASDNVLNASNNLETLSVIEIDTPVIFLNVDICLETESVISYVFCVRSN